MKITIREILAAEPCRQYNSEFRIRKSIKEEIKDGWTPEEILNFPIPLEDRMWVILSLEKIMPHKKQIALVKKCMHLALDIFSKHMDSTNIIAAKTLMKTMKTIFHVDDMAGATYNLDLLYNLDDALLELYYIMQHGISVCNFFYGLMDDDDDRYAEEFQKLETLIIKHTLHLIK